MQVDFPSVGPINPKHPPSGMSNETVFKAGLSPYIFESDSIDHGFHPFYGNVLLTTSIYDGNFLRVLQWTPPDTIEPNKKVPVTSYFLLYSFMITSI